MHGGSKDIISPCTKTDRLDFFVREIVLHGVSQSQNVQQYEQAL